MSNTLISCIDTHNAVKIQDSIPPYQITQTFNASMSKYFAMKVLNLNSNSIISGCPDEQNEETFPCYFHELFQLILFSSLLDMHYKGMSSSVEDPVQQ